MNKRIAYVAIVNSDGYTLGVAEEGEPGYYPLRDAPKFNSYAEASATASLRNVEELGLTVKEGLSIALSSMGKRGVA